MTELLQPGGGDYFDLEYDVPADDSEEHLRACHVLGWDTSVRRGR